MHASLLEQKILVIQLHLSMIFVNIFVNCSVESVFVCLKMWIFDNSKTEEY